VGEVRWSLETFDGTALASGAQPLFAAPLAATPITTLDFSRQLDDEQQRQTVCVVELWQGGQMAQRTLATFAPDKHLALPDPHLTVTSELHGDELRFTLHAEALARWIEIELHDADVIFSDNAFDLPAGRTTVITCPLPSGWTLAQAQAALRVRSLYDTY
jgi:beta-mannosidase